MRRVIVSKHVQQEDKRWKLEEIGEAFFHQFGMQYEEFESSAGNFTTAIVEMPSGEVLNVPAEHIRFLDQPVKAQ